MWKEILSRLPKGRTYTLSAILLFIVGMEIVLTCAIPMWREYFYNILQTKNKDLFVGAVVLFFVLMTSLGAAQGLKVWIGKKLSFIAREFGTKILFKKWVGKSELLPNYNQPINVALRTSTETMLEIAIEILISGAIVVILIGASLHSPMILLAALIYTIVATVAALLFNRPLIHTNKSWMEAEGELAQAVSAVYHGKGDYSFKEKLIHTTIRYYQYIKVAMYFELFSRVKGSMAAVVPYFLLSGAYFSGAINLGDFMAGVSSFELIVVNSTILLQLYPKLMAAVSSSKIAVEFYHDLKGKD